MSVCELCNPEFSVSVESELYAWLFNLVKHVGADFFLAHFTAFHP